MKSEKKSDIDPYLWLEEIQGEKALAWVCAQNTYSTNEMTQAPSFEILRQRFLKIYNSKEKIPLVKKLGPFLYNFWQDDQHVHGIFRRTTMEEYRSPNPKWETILDLDRLAADEKENWVWKGYQALFPEYDLCLISLSRGGADAAVVRSPSLCPIFCGMAVF